MVEVVSPFKPCLRFLFGLCLFAALVVPAEGQTSDQLSLNLRIQKLIAAGEQHTYQFEAQANHYLRFRIGRSSARLLLVIRSAAGRQMANLRCLRSESIWFSFLPVETGKYSLAVRSEEGNEVPGRYDLTFDERRPAVAKDARRIVAEQALSEGDALRAEWNAGASRKALAKYRAALLGWQVTGDEAGQARALLAIGDVFRSQSELQNGRDSYTQAYRLAGNDARLRAAATIGLGHISITLGEPQKSIEFGKEARAGYQEAADREGEVRALLCIGDAYFYMDGRGEDYYEQALKAALEVGDLAGQATALMDLSYLLRQLEQKQPQALQYQEKALEIWRCLEDKRGQATTLIALGNLTSSLGDKQKALAYYHEAEPLVIGCGEADNEARLYGGMGFVHEGFGQQTEALQYYLKSLAKWRAAKFRIVEVEALAQAARLYLETGDRRQALNAVLQAEAILKTIKSSPTEAWVYAHMGAVYADSGRDKEAQTAYEQALKEHIKALPWIRALALNGLGKILHRRGAYQEAIAWYQRALTVSRDARESFVEVSTLNHIARAERDSGNLEAAQQTLSEAIGKIEALRAKMAGQSMRVSYFAATREVYELTIDVYMQLSQQGQKQQYVSRAFELTEQSRARALLDMLVESKTRLSPENNTKLLEEERELQSLISGKNLELAQLYAKPAAQAQIQVAEEELENFIRRNEVVQSLMRAASPQYDAITRPDPLKLAEIQQLLDPETLLLEYSLGDDRSYLWAITQDSITSFPLPAQAQIEKAAREVYELLIAPNKLVKGETDSQREARLARAEAEYPKASLRLSQLVLAPVAARLTRNRVVIVADGALQYIPFAMLPEPVAGSQSPVAGDNANANRLPTTGYRPLIVGHEIIILPSASALAAIRRELQSRKPAAKAVAVIADPVFTKEDAKSRRLEIRRNETRQPPPRSGNPQGVRQMELEQNKILLDRLPFSHEEARTILSIAPKEDSLGLLNFQANKQNLSHAGLQQYRIIHFATHGLLNSHHPELSKIILSLVDEEGKSQDGLLQLHEIYRLKLPAELVVLSACQTALGKEIKGEGLVGLTRGFMYGGAARVVASLWNVNDAATADLMGYFYRYMLLDHQRPAEALRNAQLKMLQHKNWKSPYYWAAFTIQGEWR